MNTDDYFKSFNYLLIKNICWPWMFLLAYKKYLKKDKLQKQLTLQLKTKIAKKSVTQEPTKWSL